MSNVQSFNPIFDQLVTTEDPQPRQLIAYALYKIAKREWAMSYRAEQSAPPNQQELRNYAKTWTSSRLEGVLAGVDLLGVIDNVGRASPVVSGPTIPGPSPSTR